MRIPTAKQLAILPSIRARDLRGVLYTQIGSAGARREDI
jgi:hypothetical protein